MNKYIDAYKLIHDLEERIFAYSEGYAEGDDNRKDAIETLLKDVKYQYSLQQEQSEKPVPKDLEEAAHLFSESSEPLYSPGHRFHWDDDALFGKQIETTFIAGGKWDREQIMENAVDGEISSVDVGDDSYIKTLKIPRLQEAIRQFNVGDKVRVIVIQE